MDSYFYNDIIVDEVNQKLINDLQAFAIKNLKQIYLINKPLGTNYSYEYKKAIVVLIPKHKIWIVNCGGDSQEDFDNYCDDFIDDLAAISDKYNYIENIGRKRQWKNDLFYICDINAVGNCISLIKETELLEQNARVSNLLISLLTGSINDITKTGKEIPNDILDSVKRRIVLYDGIQTDFIYNKLSKKVVKIQGLAGTGKTELLLRKLKEIYSNVETKGSKIAFTCFNKILAQNLRERIPEFFNFMRVEEQIRWNETLFVMSSWGSNHKQLSGVYSYICYNYNLNFLPYSYETSFDLVCKKAIKELKSKKEIGYCFDYMLIDESQDFPKSFLELCELVTSKQIFVAGDIFQNIFDVTENETAPDYLLNKCYRTDPKTLIFAHAMGMKLLDDNNPESYITWLTDSEWELCGYDYNRNNDKFNFSRKPISRFEDIDTSLINSIDLRVKSFKDYSDEIIAIIEELKLNYKNVMPEDIGIIFLENENENYKLIDILSSKIYTKFNWLVNKGYVSKIKQSGQLFISNINNVKGLEFPFIICISKNTLNNSYKIRNAMYMVLTRSFISSYFIISDRNEKNVVDNIKSNMDFLLKTGTLSINEPTEEQKENKRKSIISNKNINLSQKEIVQKILNELGVKKSDKSKIHEMVKIAQPDENDYGRIRDMVENFINIIK